MVILVLNCGSSSIKYQVIDMEAASSELLAKGLVERIRTCGGRPDPQTRGQREIRAAPADSGPHDGHRAGHGGPDRPPARGHRLARRAESRRPPRGARRRILPAELPGQRRHEREDTFAVPDSAAAQSGELRGAYTPSRRSCRACRRSRCSTRRSTRPSRP